LTKSEKQWSIGIYQGDTPFSLRPVANNPVIQAQDITDLDAQFVADPFMLEHQGEWFLFFETLPKALNSLTNPTLAKGVIGLAKSSNGIDWHYQGTVLQEPWHLSYPHVFESQGVHYMLPETLEADCIRLYKADIFPTIWSPIADLLPGRHADASLFHYQQTWWMFSCATPEQHDTLELHYSTDLMGPWIAHPSNPIIKNDARIARPAGRVIEWQNKLFRFAQDCFPRYGSQVRVFEITGLSPDSYTEREHQSSPLLSPTGQGWNGRNMHHVDLHQLDNGQWQACADGYYLD
jgi:hypothetical protein